MASRSAPLTLARRLLPVLALCLAASAGLGPVADAGQANPPPLTVAVAHLAAAPMPGERVRTPPGIELALATDLAQRAKAALVLSAAPAAALQASPTRHGARLAFVRVAAGTQAPVGTVYTALGYDTRPMAILRTDTDIRSWADARGRSACVVAGSSHVGRLAARHGLVEQVYGTATEALIGVRVGTCDMMVHDDRFLEALLHYPEWQKFSATLRDTPVETLVLVSDAGDTDATRLARQAARDWRHDQHLSRLLTRRAQEIAFEVYLEQDTVDCH